MHTYGRVHKKSLYSYLSYVWSDAETVQEIPPTCLLLKFPCPFLIISLSSATKVLKSLTNLLQKLAKLWNLLTSLTFFVVGQFWMAFTFFGSTCTPFELIIKPRKITWSIKNTHFSMLVYNFYTYNPYLVLKDVFHHPPSIIHGTYFLNQFFENMQDHILRLINHLTWE